MRAARDALHVFRSATPRSFPCAGPTIRDLAREGDPRPAISLRRDAPCRYAASVSDPSAAPRIAGLVPAAGSSRRLGVDKRRLAHEGRTVIEVTVDRLRRGGLHPIVVVLEPDSPCAALPGLQRDAVILVVNPDPDRGMLSSIRAGLAALPADVDAAAVQPGDHAFIPPSAVRALVAGFVRVGPALLVPRYPEGRGHPLIIPRELFDDARACDDRVGLRQLIARCADRVVELALDHAGADADLDLPEDLQRLRR